MGVCLTERDTESHRILGYLQACSSDPSMDSIRCIQILTPDSNSIDQDGKGNRNALMTLADFVVARLSLILPQPIVDYKSKLK